VYGSSGNVFLLSQITIRTTASNEGDETSCGMMKNDDEQ